ncbi:MAG TPA: 4'-phosphopantetheinyl transferase superfamily protein [Desulfomonilaceae bacterium]|nr:4'-phosphopantetheinyl transferase superfamily protein [Desulfomonilaceae bacterium]
MGKLHLMIAGREEGSISFSHVPGITWAALCLDARIGIDVTQFHEFLEPYPFHRAFCEEEAACSIAAGAGPISTSAALIWSAKEAAVKAVGSGFHLLDPLHVKIRVTSFEQGQAYSEAHVERSPEQYSSCEPCGLTVRSFRRGEGWVSIAALHSGAPGIERSAVVNYSQGQDQKEV